MNSAIASTIVVGLALMIPACQHKVEKSSPSSVKSETENPPTQPVANSHPKRDVPSELPRVSDERYQGPTVRIVEMPCEGTHSPEIVYIEVTTPTGGWSLQLDERHLVGEIAKLFITLEQPAVDEIVTQALVNHRKEFATDIATSHVEVYVHLAQRGVQTLTTDYRLAARSTRPTTPSNPAN
jgi:hypothetical protein